MQTESARPSKRAIKARIKKLQADFDQQAKTIHPNGLPIWLLGSKIHNVHSGMGRLVQIADAELDHVYELKDKDPPFGTVATRYAKADPQLAMIAHKRLRRDREHFAEKDMDPAIAATFEAVQWLGFGLDKPGVFTTNLRRDLNTLADLLPNFPLGLVDPDWVAEWNRIQDGLTAFVRELGIVEPIPVQTVAAAESLSEKFSIKDKPPTPQQRHIEQVLRECGPLTQVGIEAELTRRGIPWGTGSVRSKHVVHYLKARGMKHGPDGYYFDDAK